MSRRNKESGQALVFGVTTLGLLLLGVAGLGVDMGYLRYEKRLEQTAADAAAIAGASNLPYSGAISGAQNAAAANGFTDASGNTVSTCTGSSPSTVPTNPPKVCVQINNPPSSGPHSTDFNYVEAIVSVIQPTFFMKMLGTNSEPVTARAVAGNLSAGGAGSGCLYALGDSNPAITITGNASLSAPQCGIVDDGGLNVTGNITIDASSIGLSGSYSHTGNVTVNPTPVTGVPAAADPLAYLTPPTAGSCVANPNLSSGGNVTLNPGNYCNGISITGNYNVTFNPGVYVLGGNFEPTGNITLTGTGVTFYVTAGTVMWTGNTTYTLTAPTTGALAGILFWQAAGDTNTATFTGNSSSKLEGAVYLPGAQITTTGNSGSAAYTIFVAKSFVWTGNSSLTLNANFGGLSGGSPIKNSVLVE